MSDDETTRGPRPDARIEPGEVNPGGVDARPDSDGVDGEVHETGEPVSRDPDPNANPAVEDALPEDVKQTEDTGTAATNSEDGASGSTGTESEESPA